MLKTRTEGRLNGRLNHRPGKTAVATPERRYRYRANAFYCDYPAQILQAGIHPFHPGWIAPVLLGREVNNPSRPARHGILRHEHPSHLHLLGLRPAGSRGIPPPGCCRVAILARFTHPLGAPAESGGIFILLIDSIERRELGRLFWI